MLGNKRGHRRGPVLRIFDSRTQAGIHQTSYTCMRASRISSRVRAHVSEEPDETQSRGSAGGSMQIARGGAAGPRAAGEPAKRMNIPRVHRTPNAARRARGRPRSHHGTRTSLRRDIEPTCPRIRTGIPKTGYVYFKRKVTFKQFPISVIRLYISDSGRRRFLFLLSNLLIESLC